MFTAPNKQKALEHIGIFTSWKEKKNQKQTRSKLGSDLMHKWDGSNAMTMDATWEKLHKTGMSYKDSKRL